MIRKNPETRANSKELIQLFEINDLIEEDKLDLNFKYWFILNIIMNYYEFNKFHFIILILKFECFNCCAFLQI